MLHKNLNAEHHLMSSLILMIHRKILKNPKNESFKAIFSSVPTDDAQMKLMRLKFGPVVELQYCLKFLS